MNNFRHLMAPPLITLSKMKLNLKYLILIQPSIIDIVVSQVKKLIIFKSNNITTQITIFKLFKDSRSNSIEFSISPIIFSSY
jgi:hypothetical protein